MTPEHPRWDEFCERLEGPEGCDFQQEVPGDADTITWKCAGGYDKTFALAILEDMGGFDIEHTVEYLNDMGGHCDCEILFNVNCEVNG